MLFQSCVHSVCTYIHMRAHRCTHMQACTHTQVQAHAHARTHTHAYKCTHAHKNTLWYAHTHAHVHTNVHRHIKHTLVHTHAYTPTCTCLHAHTCSSYPTPTLHSPTPTINSWLFKITPSLRAARNWDDSNMLTYFYEVACNLHIPPLRPVILSILLFFLPLTGSAHAVPRSCLGDLQNSGQERGAAGGCLCKSCMFHRCFFSEWVHGGFFGVCVCCCCCCCLGGVGCC